ncbi:hypothetical protein KT71_09327 [Congregibacter litoralis KT71]|uniref:Uncharacterized protein n=1 Tax=Congregibacter litoralis KT71 TaxID=314285 RepID=A4A4U6_9GAMM|nr:hypothetical protein KT71_09327 [Congregibacter litoralis KT71]
MRTSELRFIPAAKNGSRCNVPRLLGYLGVFFLALFATRFAWSQKPDFNVTVNIGPVAPSSTAVFLGKFAACA